MQLQLDQNQKRAVEYDRGNLLVIAGPGAGKTRVIIGRMQHLVENGADPTRILAVTFTNKAADEIKERVVVSIPQERGEPVVSTFHSYALRIVRDFHESAGVGEHFTVVDEQAQVEILRMLLKANNIVPSVTTLRRLKAHLDYEKARASYPIGHPALKSELFEEIRAVYKNYHEFLVEHDAIDFNDLIILAMMILGGDENARNKIKNRFDHILLDEFQDINRAQYDLVRLMVRDDARVLAVADGDQMIYNFRGSDSRLIGAFLKDYSAEKIELIANYRSKDGIILACKSLIAMNLAEYKKKLKIPQKTEPLVGLFETDDDADEARVVARIIERNVERGFKLGDFAVIYRAHDFGDEVERELASRNIPVLRVRQKDHIVREEIEQIMAYIRLSQKLFDWDVKNAWDFPRRILNPLEGYRIIEKARKQGISLFKLASDALQLREISLIARKKLQRFAKLVQDLSMIGDELSPSGYFQKLRKELGTFLSPFNPMEENVLAKKLSEINFDSSSLENRLLDSDKKPRVLILHRGGMTFQLVAVMVARALRDYLKISCQIALVGGISENTWKSLDSKVTGENPLVVIYLGEESDTGELLEQLWARGLAFELFSIVPAEKDEQFTVAEIAYRFLVKLLAGTPVSDDERMVFYDLETTGVDTRRCEIIELSALSSSLNENDPETYNTLVKSDFMPPKDVQELTGITPEMLKSGIEPERAITEFEAFLGDGILVGHNIESFDNQIMERYYQKYFNRSFMPGFIDTVLWARDLFPHQNNKLEALGERFGLQTRGLHRAGEDVRLNQEVFTKLLEFDNLTRGLDFSREAIILMALASLEREKPEDGTGGVFISAAIRILASEEIDRKSFENDLAKAFNERVLRDLKERIELLSKEPYPEDPERERWEAIADYIASMILKFEERGSEDGIGGFLNHYALLSEGDLLGEGNAVKMMTIHAAKGLEFPIVIIIGLEQGSIPHYLAREKLESIQEERRLLYVAMSRAREKIYLVYAKKRDGRFRLPSMFLQEIPPELLRRYRLK